MDATQKQKAETVHQFNTIGNLFHSVDNPHTFLGENQIDIITEDSKRKRIRNMVSIGLYSSMYMLIMDDYSTITVQSDHPIYF